MPQPRLLPQLEPAPAPQRSLADDMIYGADAIAAELGLTAGRTAHQARKAVYKLHAAGRMPILKLDGVGFAARRSALKAFIERQERAALEAGTVEPRPRRG